jgi:hypothetical protein
MNDIKELFSQVTELIFNEVSNKLDQNANVVDGKLTEMYQGVRSLESKISEIVKDVSELKDEFSNYQRVSIVSNLNNQIKGKDRELTQLRKQLEKSTENVVRVTHPPVEIPQAETTDNIVTTVEETVDTTEDSVQETTVDDNVYEAETEAEAEAEAEEEEEVVEVVAEAEAEAEAEEVVEVVEAETEAEAEAEEEEVVEVVEAEEEEVVEVVEAETESVEEEEDEEGVSLIEKMLKDPKTGKRRKFLITEDNDKDIYDIDADGDPGDEPIGKLTGKNNRPTWF